MRVRLSPPAQRSLQNRLIRWYKHGARDLPWRQTRDPYPILVSEIMLQQTQVRTVIPYFHRFLEAFPTSRHLARASLHHVLKRWEGLGYYARARNLHALAKEVLRKYKGRIPDTYRALIRLPGIGRYTAGAVLSIAYNKNYPVLDGNVQRVLCRYLGIREDLRKPSTQTRLWELAERLVPSGKAGAYNQALMELGATVCLPHIPDCPRCPVEANCWARRHGRQREIPSKSKTQKIPHYDIAAGVIRRNGEILIAQRPLKGLLGGLWEFPGGKQEPGESLEHCVQREIQEELGVTVEPRKKIAVVPHAYSHFRITLHAFDCVYRSGKPQALGCAAWRWVKPPQLTKFAFPAANQPILHLLTA